jgi:hypothetical protein
MSTLKYKIWNEDDARRLEKAYNGTLLTADEFKANATSAFWWLTDLTDGAGRFRSFAADHLLIFDHTPSPPNDTQRYTIHFYTDSYRYKLTVVVPSGRVAQQNGYVGLSYSERKTLAGEEGHRGNDLPDGVYNQDTWRKVLAAIVRNEMVPLQCFSKDTTTVELEFGASDDGDKDPADMAIERELKDQMWRKAVIEELLEIRSALPAPAPDTEPEARLRRENELLRKGLWARKAGFPVDICPFCEAPLETNGSAEGGLLTYNWKCLQCKLEHSMTARKGDPLWTWFYGKQA